MISLLYFLTKGISTIPCEILQYRRVTSFYVSADRKLVIMLMEARATELEPMLSETGARVG
jgi:hypothetical protein